MRLPLTWLSPPHPDPLPLKGRGDKKGERGLEEQCKKDSSSYSF